MGTGSITLQALLLYYPVRGAGADGNTQCKLQIPWLSGVLRPSQEADRYGQARLGGKLQLTPTASLLRENPQLRPNIYQVLREVCLMRGTELPIKDVSIIFPYTEL